MKALDDQQQAAFNNVRNDCGGNVLDDNTRSKVLGAAFGGVSPAQPITESVAAPVTEDVRKQISDLKAQLALLEAKAGGASSSPSTQPAQPAADPVDSNSPVGVVDLVEVFQHHTKIEKQEQAQQDDVRSKAMENIDMDICFDLIGR